MRRLPVSLPLILCLLGTGVQWDMLQVFAWGRMIVDHSRTMSLTEAVSTTFDGEMCCFCRIVAKAKSQGQSRSSTTNDDADARLLLFCQGEPTVIVESPRVCWWRPAEPGKLPELNFAPPVPPPRGLAA